MKNFEIAKAGRLLSEEKALLLAAKSSLLEMRTGKSRPATSVD